MVGVQPWCMLWADEKGLRITDQEETLNIGVVLGTRPEIIKMSPVIRSLKGRGVDFFILHTGQHYSCGLDRVFFEQLELPLAKYNLEVGSGSHAEQTAKILLGAERVLREENPDIVLAEGDTNSVLGTALAASKLHLAFGHVEAGLRSYDRWMPEEINRIVADHCADYLFAPTSKAKTILLSESIPEEKVFVTGNTIVDAVYQNVDVARERGTILDSLQLSPGEYLLVTLHRQENVDSADRYGSILDGLDRVAKTSRLPVVYPIHPRSRTRMKEFALTAPKLTLIEPVGYLDFLQLEHNARLVLTDSGGVQEEACILGVPCVTLRDNTERPETLSVGSNVLAGTSPDRILECAKVMLGRKSCWQNPFGPIQQSY